MKEILKVLGIFVVFAAFIFALNTIDYASLKFWAPKYEQVRRDVVLQSQSYIQGKNINIAQMKLDYETASDDQKKAIRRMVLEEAATVDMDNLSPSNQAFISSLRSR